MNILKNKLIVKSYKMLILRAVLAGLSISFGTLASKMCPFPEIAPLLFAVGIFLVMELNFSLITRTIPTYGHNYPINSLIILVVNLLVAFLCGLPFDLPLIVPEHLFFMSIGGGAMIGIVSLLNIYAKKYRTLIMLMVMYIFVMLGMPHCVVYAFLGADFLTLLTVICGNIIGGLLVGYFVHMSQDSKFLK